MTRTEVHPFLATQNIVDRTRALLAAKGSNPEERVLQAAVEASAMSLWRALKTGTPPK